MKIIFDCSCLLYCINTFFRSEEYIFCKILLTLVESFQLGYFLWGFFFFSFSDFPHENLISPINQSYLVCVCAGFLLHAIAIKSISTTANIPTCNNLLHIERVGQNGKCHWSMLSPAYNQLKKNNICCPDSVFSNKKIPVLNSTVS